MTRLVITLREKAGELFVRIESVSVAKPKPSPMEYEAQSLILQAMQDSIPKAVKYIGLPKPSRN
jgi:hypothetical protein